jgi:S1-C subfamily serine protease
VLVRPSIRTLARRPAVLFAFAGAVTALLLSGLLPGGGARARAASVSTNPTTGVVNVQTYLGYQRATAAASGIVVTASGKMLTSNHVIRGATRIRVTVPATGHSYSATVVGYSLSADVALLKLANAAGLTTATLGNSAKVKVGDKVTAVGNAGGAGGTPTVTRGTVTAVHRSITVGDEQGGVSRLTDLIGTNAPLERGDSGGALLDSSERVIGINAAASAGFTFRGGGGFAIPINRAVTIMKLIEAGRSTATVHVGPTSFLGIAVGSVDRAGATGGGALVTGVLSGSPGDKAGLAVGDVITFLAGQTISSPTSVINALLRTSPGDTLRIRWSHRAGTSHSGTVRPIAGPPQ